MNTIIWDCAPLTKVWGVDWWRLFAAPGRNADLSSPRSGPYLREEQPAANTSTAENVPSPQIATGDGYTAAENLSSPQTTTSLSTDLHTVPIDQRVDYIASHFRHPKYTITAPESKDWVQFIHHHPADESTLCTVTVYPNLCYDIRAHGQRSAQLPSKDPSEDAQVVNSSTELQSILEMVLAAKPCRGLDANKYKSLRAGYKPPETVPRLDEASNHVHTAYFSPCCQVFKEGRSLICSSCRKLDDSWRSALSKSRKRTAAETLRALAKQKKLADALYQAEQLVADLQAKVVAQRSEMMAM